MTAAPVDPGEDTERAAPSGRRSTFAPFAHRNFRIYWIGQLLSLFGTWMQSVAQAWLVLEKSDSPWMVGVVAALQFTPVTVLGLVGGVASDRVNKRRMLFWTQSIAALQALTLGLLTVTGRVELPHVMVLAFLLGVINAFDMPLRQTFVMEMVGRADLMQGIAWNSAAFNMARIVGPAIGGVLIAAIGVGPVFFLNGASFVFMLLALLAIREAQLQARPRVAASEGLWRSLRAGLRVVRSDPLLWAPVALVGGVATFGMNFQVVLSTMARDVFRIGSEGFGMLMAATGIGSVAAGLHLAYRGRVNGPRTLLLGGAGVGLAGILFAWSPQWHALPLSIVILLGLGYAAITMTATANNVVQQRAPEALRGRVLSIYLTAFAGSVPLGGLFAGRVARWKGAPAAALAGGILSLLVVLVVALALRRSGSRGEPAPAG